jgi:hypothetical protein
MNRLSFKLAAVLGLQLVLALVLWAGGPDYTAFKAKEPLLSFDPAKVDRIEIAESSASSAVLVKEDGKWIIPSSADFPADGAKVSGLLAKLAGLKKGWPVASSVEAAKRFKVTADAYERRIVLKSGGSELGEILLGSSPNFKAVNARAGNDSHVYSIGFATYEAGARAEDWMDRSLLTIQQDQIASIAIGDAVLERKDGKFVLEGLAKDQKQDETATYRLVGALTYPAFDAVAGKGAEAVAKANEPTVEVTIKRTAGDPIVLKYKKEAGGGAYLFTSSANSFLFRASEAAVEPVVKAKRETLIEAPKKAEAEEPKNASDEAAQAATEPLKPEEPKKAEAEGAEAVPAAETKGAEDERFQAAMQPPKPEEPKKAQDEAAPAVPAEEPKKAGDEHAPAAAKAAKPEEQRNATGEGAQVAQPEKPAEPQQPNGG